MEVRHSRRVVLATASAWAVNASARASRFCLRYSACCVAMLHKSRVVDDMTSPIALGVDMTKAEFLPSYRCGPQAVHVYKKTVNTVFKIRRSTASALSEAATAVSA